MAVTVHGNLTGSDTHVPGYRASSDPGAVGAGRWWEDTTTTPSVYKVRNGANTGWTTLGAPSGTAQKVWSATSDVTVASSTAETTLLAAATGSKVFAANTLAVGSSIRLKLYGHFQNNSGNLRYRLKFGGVTIWDTTAFPLTGWATYGFLDLYWEAEFIITCRATGGSGSLQAIGRVMLQYDDVSLNPQAMLLTPNTQPGTSLLDTTASNTLDCTVQFSVSNAANKTVVTAGTIELLP